MEIAVVAGRGGQNLEAIRWLNQPSLALEAATLLTRRSGDAGAVVANTVDKPR